MRLYLIFIAIGLLSLASSCSKFLEESSQSEVVPRTAESLNEYLLGDAYPQLYSNSFYPEESYLHDDIEMNAYRAKDVLTFIYTWQPDMDKVTLGGSTPWQSIYTAIQACNTTLDYLPKVTGKQAFKNYVGGQAQLLRAFLYFKLVNLYALPYNDRQSDPKTNLAVPLLLTGGVELSRKPRNTVAELYTQIEKDLKEGIALIEGSGQVHNKFRMGSNAGHLLASRVYLSMEKWAEVIKHTDVLVGGTYKLMDLRNWGPPDAQLNPVISAGNPETIWAFSAYNDVSVSDTIAFKASADLRQRYVAGDLRNGIYLANGVYKKVFNPGNNPAQAFRVSEAYLNRAEAFAQLYKSGTSNAGQQCINLLNALREKRFSSDKYVPWTLQALDKDLLQYVRAERRRELYGEGHRWFDLRRYGMPRIEHRFFSSETQVNKYVLEERDPGYVLPIPRTAIALNPNLIQNPLAPIRQPK